MANRVQLLPPWALDTMPAQGGSQPHLDAVIDAIELLTPGQRELIEALFFERLGVNQLARRRGVSHVAVVRMKHRAFKNLRRMLEDEQP